MRLDTELVQTLLKSLLKDCCLFTETMLTKNMITKLFPGYPMTDISDKPSNFLHELCRIRFLYSLFKPVKRGSQVSIPSLC